MGLEGIEPDQHGALDEGEMASLEAIATELGHVKGLYLVCHLASPPSLADALDRSQDCADGAAASMQALGVEVDAFAAGALLPRANAPRNRLELVLPPP